MIDLISGAVLPYLIEWIIGILFAYGLKLLHDHTGITLENSRREALQSALTNAALRYAEQNNFAGAKEYVRMSVPDAVDKFGLDDIKLDNLLAPKFEAVKKRLEGLTGLF